MNEAIAQKLHIFFLQFTKLHYKRGEVVIRADDEPQGVFYLQTGSVRMYAISKKGEEVVLNIFKPISFFPMGWAINSSHNTYFYEAVTDVEVWRAPREDVVGFLKNNPDVLYDLISRVYKGLDGLLGRMSYLMAGSAYVRLITEMLIVGRRFGTTSEKGVTLAISEKELAAQTGLTRETISRQIKTLKDKNLVTLTQNAIVIHSMDELEAELDSHD